MRTLIIITTILLFGHVVYSQSAVDKDLILALVNKARTADCLCGTEEQKSAPSLQWDKALEKAAQKHANDMARKKFFSHTGSDQSSVSKRVEREKFEWSIVGENIAMGHMDEETVVNGWMNSPGHCKNIMNPEFKYMGVAVSSDGKYWVQVFADKMTD